MRMSCNGCRVLRKGCSEDCNIRPCLEWIKNPEAQGNATVFLAKFYGRAGLINLINAGPDHLRPAIFRSLLYEACGRVVNPIYGSVGLLWSGNWQLCQAAVDSVLKGTPIMQISSEAAAASSPMPPLKAFDIRHVAKDDGEASHELHKVARAGRTLFKRSAPACKHEVGRVEERTQSNESSGSHVSAGGDLDWTENDSIVSEGSSMVTSHGMSDDEEVRLELTLGPAAAAVKRTPAKGFEVVATERESEGDTCTVDLVLDLAAR